MKNLQNLTVTISLALAIFAVFSQTAFSIDEKTHRLLFQALPEVKLAEKSTSEFSKIELGKKLFKDPKLSSNSTISCNSCHSLDNFGVDSKPVSPGTDGQLGNRNSPTVYNSSLHIAQFWDGRAKDVEEQALGPIMNPVEMSMPTEKVVMERLEKDSEYIELFKKAFPEEKQPLTFANIGAAIGAFERTLITPSRFDEYLTGKNKALTAEEIAGLNKFIEVGCTACHSGALLGGNAFQKLGLAKNYPTNKAADYGRFAVTKSESDKMVFKVPALRNVEKTAPYLHDGSVNSLEEAIKIMAEYQLGKDLSQDDVKAIAVFLKSLTGKLPKNI